MSRLTIYSETTREQALLHTSDAGIIIRELAAIGIRFEQWQARVALPAHTDDKAVLDAYAGDIARLQREGGYQAVDVVRCLPDNPNCEALRAKFLSEHTHAEDEVRFFVEGSGLFCVHKNARVYQVLCERGDLISVPAGTKHWFDMSEKPYFTAIRLFTNPEGWVAQFTGDTIADAFPKMAHEPA